MKKILLFILLTLSLLACKSTEETATITQHNCDKEYVKKGYLADEKRIGIYAPFEFTVQNNSYFSEIRYLLPYISKNEKGGVDSASPIGFDKNNNRKPIIFGVELNPRKKLNTKFYIHFFIIRNAKNSKEYDDLLSYFETLKKGEVEDALTVTEFRSKYKTLYKEIVNKDFIIFNFVDGEKKGDRMPVPIKF